MLSHTQELSLACLDVWTLATLFSLNYFASKGGATNTCFYCTKTINAGSLENSLQFSSTVQHSLVYSSFHIFCPKHVKTNRVPWQTGTFSKWDSHRPLLHSLSPHTFLSFCCCDAALVLCSLSPWSVLEVCSWYVRFCRCRGWKLRWDTMMSLLSLSRTGVNDWRFNFNNYDRWRQTIGKDTMKEALDIALGGDNWGCTWLNFNHDDCWRQTLGRQLRKLLTHLSRTFPSLSSPFPLPPIVSWR